MNVTTTTGGIMPEHVRVGSIIDNLKYFYERAKWLEGQYSLLESDLLRTQKTRDKALYANSELAKHNSDIDDLNKELIKDNEGLREELKIVDASCRDCDIGYNKKIAEAGAK